MAILSRSMRHVGDRPAVGPTARTLGIRPGIDVLIMDGMVRPGEGGMSVTPNDPRHLPPFRRPPELGATGRDPTFALDEQTLGPDLVYRPDPLDPERHGFIEPAREMAIDDFLRALAATQAPWRRHQP